MRHRSLKETRRADWKTLNFAGTIDWAIDLQAFGQEDLRGAGHPIAVVRRGGLRSGREF